VKRIESTSPSSIRLAGAAWSWVGTTIAESAAIYRAIGIEAIDLIAIPGSRLDTDEIAAAPRQQAELLSGLEAKLSNLFVFFGRDFRDRALNDPDAQVRGRNRETFKRLLEYSVAADFHSMTVLPGVEQPPHSRQDALNWAAEELNTMNKLANGSGVLLVYEPHVQSILEAPQEALAFARANSDVKLVIDYSHGVSLGYSCADLEPLIAHAGHVHLRQAAAGRIQARWDEGIINFPRLITQLRRNNYQGYVTLEYEHDKFWEMDQCDVMTETIKMRDTVFPSVS
jgi:sugar phosphate isomerase/epimerase